MANVSGSVRHIVHGEWKAKGSVWMFAQTLSLLLIYLALNFYISDEGRKMAIDEIFDGQAAISYDSIRAIKASAYEAALSEYTSDTLRIRATFADDAGRDDIDKAKKDLQTRMAVWMRKKKTDPEAWERWASKAYSDGAQSLSDMDLLKAGSSRENAAKEIAARATARERYERRVNAADASYEASKEAVDVMAEGSAEDYDAKKGAWSWAYFLLVIVTTFGVVGFTFNRETYFKIAGVDPGGERYVPTLGRQKLITETVGWVKDWLQHAATEVKNSRTKANEDRSSSTWTLPALRKVFTLLLTLAWLLCVFYLSVREGTWRDSTMSIMATSYVFGIFVVGLAMWLNGFLWDAITRTPSKKTKTKKSAEAEWVSRDGGKTSPSRSREDRSAQPYLAGGRENFTSSVPAATKPRTPSAPVVDGDNFTPDRTTMKKRMRGWKATLAASSNPETIESIKARLERAQVYIDEL